MTRIDRRRMLVESTRTLGALAAAPVLGTVLAAESETETAPQFKIGACDWSLRARQTPEAFAVAREIGLDGVEVSFSEPGSKFDLRDPAVRGQYQASARKHRQEIASLAMGVLNQVPYASDPRTEQWVSDVVDVMPRVGVTCCLLAFFGNGDIQGDRGKQDEVIRRLKKVAPRAETAGVVLGIESWMNADEHLRILDAVDSPAVKVYYDVANMTTRGYDVGREIRQLGKDRICQMHMKENGQLLGRGKVDFARVKEAVEDIGYHGWLILEGATVPDKSLIECYKINLAFLRELFEIS
jgi:sugar phosphate isomerase/epimerase